MRTHLLMALSAATATATAFLATTSAMASGTWTVTGGIPWTSAASTGATFSLLDHTSGLSFTCTTGTAAGTVVDESGSTGTAIGSITSGTFGSSAHKCNGPLGSTATDSQKNGTTATLNVASFSGGVTTGDITGVDHILTIRSFLGVCTTEYEGTSDITYQNSSHLLQFTADTLHQLEVTSTSGSCAGIIKTGDILTWTSGTGGEAISALWPVQISQP